MLTQIRNTATEDRNNEIPLLNMLIEQIVNNQVPDISTLDDLAT